MELRLSERHIMALNVLLVAVLAYFGVLAVNDVLVLRRGSIDAPMQRTHGKIAAASVGDQSRAAYQAIVERDIFNLVPPPAPAVEVVIEDLHLTLIGVSQATKGKPYAIVADRKGEQSVYRVGEVIPGSGKLLEVGKDRAVVEHGGKRVALEIPKDDTGGPPASLTPEAAGRRFVAAEPPAERSVAVSEASSNDAANHHRAHLMDQLRHLQ